METHNSKNGNGPKRRRNKELTMQRMIDAVGSIIKRDGWTGFGLNKVAREAEVDKTLINRYFGSLNNLIDCYVAKKDFWMLANKDLKERAADEELDLAKEVSKILEDQFNFFYSEKEMQQLILWELNGSIQMKKVSHEREKLAEQFLKLTDAHFQDSGINFRAVSSLLSAAIYYLVMHAPVDTYCGLDLNEIRHRNEVMRTIKQILDWAFEKAKEAKKNSDGS